MNQNILKQNDLHRKFSLHRPYYKAY